MLSNAFISFNVFISGQKQEKMNQKPKFIKKTK